MLLLWDIERERKANRIIDWRLQTVGTTQQQQTKISQRISHSNISYSRDNEILLAGGLYATILYFLKCLQTSLLNKFYCICCVRVSMKKMRAAN